MYHKILAKVFASCRDRSRYGDVLRFGDDTVRVGHPGILIESLDHMEAIYWLMIRGGWANFPCPKCLVPKEQLHRLDKKFPLRTLEDTKKIQQRARDATTKGDREDILKNHGLHLVDVSSHSPRSSLL